MCDALSGLSLEEVLVDEAAIRLYTHEMDEVFYPQLIQLHNTLFILNKISEFPFFLLGYGVNPFFVLVTSNFIDTAILIINRLVNDKHHDFYSLRKGFRDRQLYQLIKPQYRDAFRQRMREQRLDQRIEEGLKKVKILRDSNIAHLKRYDKPLEDPASPEDVRLTLEELEELCQAITDLFNSLTFDKAYMFLYPSYNSMVQRPGSFTSDIGRILDAIAQDSSLLHEPEDYPDLWQSRREKLTPRMLDMINKYREKFGLPQA